MERPEKIYLDEPIVMAGDIKVGHTRQGLVYLIDHYTTILQHDNDKIKPGDRQHIQQLIANWTIHLTLYDNEQQQRIAETDLAPDAAPALRDEREAQPEQHATPRDQ